jgi:hypothetical protein
MTWAWGAASGAVAGWSFVPYLRGIRRDPSVRPSPLSWLIWAALDVLVTGSQYAGGGRASLAMAAADAAGCIVIFVLAWRRARRVDRLAFRRACHSDRARPGRQRHRRRGHRPQGRDPPGQRATGVPVLVWRRRRARPARGRPARRHLVRQPCRRADAHHRRDRLRAA